MSAVAIADAGHRRRRVFAVGGLALRTGLAPGEPPDQDVGRHLEQDDVVDAPPPALQHLVERLRLRHGAGETVEEEALDDARRGQRLVDDAVDDVVGHQLARVHQRLRLAAERRPIGDRLAQDVARRQLRDAVAEDQPLGLCALPCSGGPEKDEVHGQPLWKSSGQATAGEPVALVFRPRMRGPRGPVKPS